MSSRAIKVFENYPLTSKFLEPQFSKISELYFNHFPEEQGGFYLPTLLKSVHKELQLPEYVFEIADFENSAENLKNLSINLEKIYGDLKSGEVILNPAHSSHRFRHDILTYSKKSVDFIDGPSKKSNVVFIAKNPDDGTLNYLKGTPQMACVVDYLAEGKLNLRILSAQLQRNFSQLFQSNDAVLESLEKLKKKYIVLQK